MLLSEHLLRKEPSTNYYNCPPDDVEKKGDRGELEKEQEGWGGCPIMINLFLRELMSNLFYITQLVTKRHKSRGTVNETFKAKSMA